MRIMRLNSPGTRESGLQNSNSGDHVGTRRSVSHGLDDHGFPVTSGRSRIDGGGGGCDGGLLETPPPSRPSEFKEPPKPIQSNYRSSLVLLPTLVSSNLHQLPTQICSCWRVSNTRLKISPILSCEGKRSIFYDSRKRVGNDLSRKPDQKEATEAQQSTRHLYIHPLHTTTNQHLPRPSRLLYRCHRIRLTTTR